MNKNIGIQAKISWDMINGQNQINIVVDDEKLKREKTLVSFDKFIWDKLSNKAKINIIEECLL